MQTRWLLSILLLVGSASSCGAPEQVGLEATQQGHDGDVDPWIAGQIGPGELEDISADDHPSALSAFALGGTPGEQIVALAIAEEGRGPEEVGDSLGQYPYDLGRYLDPGEAWCSEFVSWAYRAAGSPLTDGIEGGWMLTNSTKLRTWFQTYSRFVEPTDTSFTPRAGDYIRYDTSSGGHSGIVRYVSGTTLYTVEGNVNNEVRLRTISNWREQSNIDGIGVLPSNSTAAGDSGSSGDDAADSTGDSSLAGVACLLTNRRDGTSVDISFDSPTSRYVYNYRDNGRDDKKWNIVAAGGGDYLVTSKLQGYALTGAQSDRDVRHLPRDGSELQLWRFVGTGDGYYKLINKASGRALDVDTGSVYAYTYTDNGNTDKHWELRCN